MTIALAQELGFTPELAVEVLSPFSRALEAGLDLNRLQSEQPEEAERHMANYVARIYAELNGAGKNNLIVYRLRGAEPKFASPMQYGGHYLEVDRGLLTAANERCEVVIVVEGGSETYLDFVSDLPAKTFAWNTAETGTSIEMMKEMRSGDLLDLNDLKQEATIGS